MKNNSIFESWIDETQFGYKKGCSLDLFQPFLSLLEENPKVAEKRREWCQVTIHFFSLFWRDVTRFLNDEPVSAAAPTLSYQVRKFYRRNQRPIVITAISIILAVVVGITAWQLTSFPAGWTTEAPTTEAPQEEYQVRKRLW